MKKYIALLLAIMLTLSLFASCTQKTNGEDNGGVTAKKTNITLSYLNWNLGTEAENNIERQMIKEFEKRTGHTVKIMTTPSADDNYTDYLQQLAAVQNTPDVAMQTSIPVALENEWIDDISEFTANDEDWKNIPEVIEESTHYKGKTYAVPAGYYLAGYIINNDLFTSANEDELEYGSSIDDFMSAIQNLTDLKSNRVGILNENDFLDWYAGAKNKSLGFYTWDGSKYHLDAPEFKEGISKMGEIRKGKFSYDSLTESERSALGGTTNEEAWNNGKVGMYYANTADVPNIVKKSKFEKTFIGVPGNRSTIVGDYMAISPTSAHKKEAYELAKWMTFSPDGIKKRLELDKDGTQFNSLPLTTDKSVVDAYFKIDRFPGIKEAFEDIESGMVEGVKTIPGYKNSRWDARTGKSIGTTTNAKIGDVYTAAWFGQVSYGDFAKDINTLANKQYETAVKTIETIY